MNLMRARAKYVSICAKLHDEVDLLIALGHPSQDDFSSPGKRFKILNEINAQTAQLRFLLSTPIELEGEST